MPRALPEDEEWSPIPPAGGLECIPILFGDGECIGMLLVAEACIAELGCMPITLCEGPGYWPAVELKGIRLELALFPLKAIPMAAWD